METGARGAADRPLDTSRSESLYSYRTSVSSSSDIRGGRGGEDRVFVGVVEDIKYGKSALMWALRNLVKDGAAQVVVAHVHCPPQMIPMMGAKLHYTRMDAQQVSDYRNKEREKALKKLDEYVAMCTSLKVNCKKILIENDDVAKGLEQLISLHGITKLVMGAAADKHYSKKMKAPKSKTSLRVMETGASSCKIWFTCKGQLICTREAYTTVPEIPLSPTHTVASTLSASSISSHMRSVTIHMSESEASSLNGSPRHDLDRSRTEVTQHPSQGDDSTASWLFAPSEFENSLTPWYSLSRIDDTPSIPEPEIRHPLHESSAEIISFPSHGLENIGADAELYVRLEEALHESQELKKEAYQESIKRRKAERDMLSVLQKAKDLEHLYHSEMSQRKATEEPLARQTREINETRIQCDRIYDELRDSEAQKVMLERSMTEMKSSLKDYQEKLVASNLLFEEVQAGKEKLQQERDALQAGKEKLQQERDTLQAGKEKLQQERDAAVTEAEELRQKTEDRISMPKEALNTDFSPFELEQATRQFDETLKIGEGGFGCVYKGLLHNTTVAIKLLHPKSMQGLSEFNQEVAVLSTVRHPNLVTLLGSCRDTFALVYEFLPNGSLDERLACKNNTAPLTWQVRTRIISEICSALTFLHSTKPHPVVHGDLKPANILLDTNFVSKLGDFGICRFLTQSNTSTTRLHQTTTPKGTFTYIDPEFMITGELTPRSDVYSLGIIILQLLTGRPPKKIAEIVEDAIENMELHSIIDPTAGSWPFVQANQLAHLGLRCAEMSRRRRPDLAQEVWKVIEPLTKAASLTTRRPSFAPYSDGTSTPSYFVCPIFQEVMSDPHIAADGFTYEAEAIRGWLDSGHDTSPMTNMSLTHRELTPNRGLRSVILEWQQQQQQRQQHKDCDDQSMNNSKAPCLLNCAPCA